MTPIDPDKPFLNNRRFMAGAMACVVVALVLVLLVQARPFLVPLVLAFLVTSIISAVIDQIRRIQIAGRTISNTFASVLALLLLMLGLTVIYSVIAEQIALVMREAPMFMIQAQAVILKLVALVSDDLAEALSAAFDSFTPRLWIMLAAGSAGSVLTTSVLIALYVGFLLAERPWIHGKIVRLFPDAERRALVEANVQAIRRNVHHFLLLKTLISAVTAGAIYLIALVFGLKFALSIALLTFLLNFIPNLGSILATALPVLVALVQFDSLSTALTVLAVVGGVQFLLGNIVDPMVTGRGMQMSSLAIIISLTFWSAIWGVVGMFLAVPLMVIVMIICAQIPALRPVAILLSKTGDLTDRTEDIAAEAEAAQAI